MTRGEENDRRRRREKAEEESWGEMELRKKARGERKKG